MRIYRKGIPICNHTENLEVTKFYLEKGITDYNKQAMKHAISHRYINIVKLLISYCGEITGEMITFIKKYDNLRQFISNNKLNEYIQPRWQLEIVNILDGISYSQLRSEFEKGYSYPIFMMVSLGIDIHIILDRYDEIREFVLIHKKSKFKRSLQNKLSDTYCNNKNLKEVVILDDFDKLEKFLENNYVDNIQDVLLDCCKNLRYNCIQLLIEYGGDINDIEILDLIYGYDEMKKILNLT